MKFENIIYEKKDCVARITINRPQQYNVLDIATMKEFNQALEDVKKDQSIKLVIVASKGKIFSGGVDIKDHTPDKYEDMINIFHRIFRNLIALPQPTLAVINGSALGGGSELATFCDMAIASETAKIGQPEIKVGVFPPIAAITFPRLIGSKKAIELLLTGDVIDAKEALRLGLVNHVVPEEKLEEEVNKLANKLLNLSGVVIKMTKRAIFQGLNRDFEEVLQKVEHIYNRELMKTKDAEEGLKAFLEKRPPVWQEK